MNRWLETDTQKTARNIINVLNESAAGMVKKEINKDKPEEAPKNKKVALEKRITRAAIKGKKPESKNAKMPKKIAKKIVREVDNKIMNELEEIKVKKKVFTESTYLNENEKLYLGRKAEVKRDVEDTDLHKGDIVTIDSVEVDVDGWDSDYVNVTRESDGKEFSGVSSYELNLLIDEGCENEKIVKEERLASLKTQLEKDKDQLAADEIEAIEKEIADLEAELFEKEKLNETGEWDNNDDEMKIWKEELRDKAEYIANEIHGSVASVSGFDKYQGPVAIISTPIHGDVQLWFDNEDDTGLSLLCKIAHVGWIQGGANYISDILSREVIPEDEIINESEKLEENQIEDARKDSIEKGLLSEAVFEIDYADDDVDLSTEESVIEDVRNWLGTLANEVKIEVPELSGPAGGWPIVRLTGNKEKIAKFLLDNYNSGGEETLDDVYDLYLQENKLQEDNLKLPSEEHPEETKKFINDYQDKKYYQLTKIGLEENKEMKPAKNTAGAIAKKESMKEDTEFKVGDVVKVPYKYGSYTPGEFTEAPIIDISEGRYVTVEIPSKLEVTMDQLKKWNTLEESDNEPKTVKEYRIMDGNKVLKTFSADERSKGYAEMRAMGKALRDAGKEDNLIYKEFTVKNKLKEEYSEKFGGDPKDFIGDLVSVKHQLSKLNLDGFGSHLARQMVEDFIDTCDRQIKKAKRLASGDEFYTEADDRTYKDRDEAEYYRNKELYANSNLARHREAMEKAKKACEEKGIKLDEDNYLSRTRKQEPLDLVAYEPEITSVDEVKDKYVKIRGDFHKVIDVKPEGDKFVISFAAGTGTAIGGEFEPATLDEIKRLQLYTENK